jgi:hypothetical protein
MHQLIILKKHPIPIMGLLSGFEVILTVFWCDLACADAQDALLFSQRERKTA